MINQEEFKILNFISTGHYNNIHLQLTPYPFLFRIDYYQFSIAAIVLAASYQFEKYSLRNITIHNKEIKQVVMEILTIEEDLQKNGRNF